MHPLSAAELLHAWELGRSQHQVERYLTLLVQATDAPRERLGLLPVGQRDELLITLREITLGSKLEGTARCPACMEQLEMSFSTADIKITDSSGMEILASGNEGMEILRQRWITSGEIDSYHLSYRPPNSSDLALIYNAPSLEQARRSLIQNCVTEATLEGDRLDPLDLPPAVVTELVERFVQADPQADIALQMVCPNCDHRWQSVFDIGAFFWAEIEGLSKRLLHDVHILAGAYGWSEADILSMTAVRRQMYLDMVMG